MRWCSRCLKTTCMPLLKFRPQLPFGVCRQASTRSWLPFQMKSPEAFARKDGLNPTQDHLIYNSGFHNYLFLTSCTSSGIALAGIGLATILSNSDQAIQPKQNMELSPMQQSMAEIFESPVQLGVGCCFATVFMLFGVYLVSHVPVRIYYSPSQQLFRMVFHRAIPGLQKVRTCRPGGLAPLGGKRDSVSTQMLGNVVDRDTNRRLMLLEQRFKTMAYYNVLMGFDSVDVLSEDTDTDIESAPYRRHDR
ncbi:unnamed protein product [Ixodes pacificus]